MTDTQLGAQDTTQILQRIFTGHVVGKPGMGDAPLEATVVSADNAKWTVVVTIDGFDSASGQPTPSFTCNYEPRHHWDATTSTKVKASPPPKGTPCLVAFPPNSPQGLGWVTSFKGWPLL